MIPEFLPVPIHRLTTQLLLPEGLRIFSGPCLSLCLSILCAWVGLWSLLTLASSLPGFVNKILKNQRLLLMVFTLYPAATAFPHPLGR